MKTPPKGSGGASLMGAPPFSNADREPTSQPERVNPIFVTECCRGLTQPLRERRMAVISVGAGMKKLFLTVLCAITLGVIGDRCEATIYDVTRGGDFTVIGPFDSQDLLDTLSVTVLETPYIPPRPLDPCPTRLHLPGPRGTSRISFSRPR